MFKNKNKIQILPLGGLEEIGKNMLLINYKDEIILIDAGLKFPDEKGYGINYVLNDPTYLIANKKKIKALLITHGHLDHIGGIPFLLSKIKLPIYAHGFTKAMIRKTIEKTSHKNNFKIISFETNQSFKIGNHFSIEAIKVDHSIIDAVSFAITTEAGTIIHTGDYKIENNTNKTDLDRFKHYGKKGVLALLMDSTNANVEKQEGTESVVYNNLEKIITSAKGKTLIGTFSTQIRRIEAILNIAKKLNKKVVLSGRSILENVDLAFGMNYLSQYEKQIIDFKSMNNYSSQNIIIILTGTQGEEQSALYKIAYNYHNNIKLQGNETIIFSSSVIPGNEAPIYKIINLLQKKGVDLITNENFLVHTSGHASQEEMKILLSKIKPKYLIPVHGEYRHLCSQQQLALKSGIKEEEIFLLENGKKIEISYHSGIRLVEQIKAKEIYIDSDSLQEINFKNLEERKHLSRVGFLSIAFHPHNFEETTIDFMGFYTREKKELLLKEIKYFLKKEISNQISKDKNQLKKKIKNSLKNFFDLKKIKTPIFSIHLIF